MVALAMIVASCLVSTMALFMGGGHGGVDLHALMLLQVLSIPVAIGAILFTLNAYSVKRLYVAVPQWLVFSFFMLFLLVASGEVAFMIVTQAADEAVVWTAHAPLLSMLACSFAICALYAYSGIKSGKPDPTSGRW